MSIPLNIDKEEMQCVVITQSPYHRGFRFEGLSCHMFRIEYHQIIVSCDLWKGIFLLQHESPYVQWNLLQKAPTEENSNHHKPTGKIIFENKKMSDIKSISLLVSDHTVDCTFMMALVNGFYMLQTDYQDKLKSYSDKNKLQYKSEQAPTKSISKTKVTNQRNSKEDI